MQIFLETQGSKIWNTVKNGPHIPVTVVNGASTLKPETSWDDDDHKFSTQASPTKIVLCAY